MTNYDWNIILFQLLLVVRILFIPYLNTLDSGYNTGLL